jgi:hypothetical protein
MLSAPNPSDQWLATQGTSPLLLAFRQIDLFALGHLSLNLSRTAQKWVQNHFTELSPVAIALAYCKERASDISSQQEGSSK